MKRYNQSTLARIVSFGFGLWLLIVLIANKSARFTKNQLDLILGAFIAVGIYLFFLWLAYHKTKTKGGKDNYQNNISYFFDSFFTLN